jgi:hypothetical protein
LPREYCEEGVAVQDELDDLEEEANLHGLEFKVRDGVILLVDMAEEEQEELARQTEREIGLTQTFPSQFSSLEAYEEWREAND